MKPQRILALLICIYTAGMLAGCGGGSTTGPGSAPAVASGRGALKLTVQWPVATSGRLIPITSQSVQVVVKSKSGTVLATPPLLTKANGTNFPNNTTSVTVSDLPAGPPGVVITATAFHQPDGSGVAQATATISFEVVANTTSRTKDLVMDTTVTNVLLTPSATSVAQGGQITVIASARDASNNVVFVAPDKYSGAANDNAAFTVVQGGSQFTLTALKTGTFTFTVKETESGVTGDLKNPLTIAVGAAAGPNVFVLEVNRVVGLSDAAPGATFSSFSLGSNFAGQDMATLSGNVYVAEAPFASGPGRIIEMVGASGQLIGSFATPGTPYFVYVDAQGHIYWFDQGPDPNQPRNTIYRVDSISGYPATLLSARVNVNPTAMASDGQNLYILDGYSDGIIALSTNLNGTPPVYGSKGNGRDNFDLSNADRTGGAVHALAIDPSGTFLYVADYNNFRIVRVRTAGFRQADFSNTAAFDFTAVPLDSSGTNGANYFKPTSVGLDNANQHVFFTGIEVKDRTMSDRPPPLGTNIVNSFVERIDVSGVSSHLTTNRSVYGGAFVLGGGANAFGHDPRAVGAN